MLASPAGVNWVSDQCRLSLTKDWRPDCYRPYALSSSIIPICKEWTQPVRFGNDSRKPTAAAVVSEWHVFLQHIGIQDLAGPFFGDSGMHDAS